MCDKVQMMAPWPLYCVLGPASCPFVCVCVCMWLGVYAGWGGSHDKVQHVLAPWPLYCVLGPCVISFCVCMQVGEDHMSRYNMSASEPPINPLNWIAGTNQERKLQQGAHSSPTAADADTQVRASRQVTFCM